MVLRACCNQRIAPYYHAAMKRLPIFLVTVVTAWTCGDSARRVEAPNATGPVIPRGATATFAILETTDLHNNIRSYDYFKLTDDKSIGLERTATLISQARAEFPSSILIDNGDSIQGTALADYQAIVSPVPCSEPLAMYKVMNAIGFDVAGIGNHDFNYGLSFLAQVTHTPFDIAGIDTTGASACKGPAFPQVLSNVFSATSGKPLFAPSTIVTKTVSYKRPNGSDAAAQLRIGIIAYAPPAITSWDKRWLDGKAVTKGVMETAPALVANLKAQGADLIVAIVHGGLDNSPYNPELENQGWHLAQVPGIDALLLGHTHSVFPNPQSTANQFNLPMVDKVDGTVNGVASVMAGFWGQHLGVIKLGLTFDGKQWRPDASKTVVEARPVASVCTGGKPVACDADNKWKTGAACAFIKACEGIADGKKAFVDADPSITQMIESEHAKTMAYVRTPIGTTDFELSSYFAEQGDPSAIQIVNQAQADYVRTYIAANLPQYAGLPVLSVSAPFKFGFQGGTDYTDVAAGPVAINNAADLYLYANTLHAVKVTGAGLKDWLETAATRFAQINPALTTDQNLINTQTAGFNFDVATDPDLTYEIDVTQPLPAAGTPATGRIKALKYKGRPIEANQEFIIATNNYRASGGGSFPGLDGSKTIYAAPDTNRDILISYIKAHPQLTRVANGATRSWRFTKVATAGRVLFSSALNALPKAITAGLTNISLAAADDGSGRTLSLYRIDLNR
jgi:2',3'-cyclic-nucleotide 2'-phosphodiesterase / 3'-nucleotidase